MQTYGCIIVFLERKVSLLKVINIVIFILMKIQKELSKAYNLKIKELLHLKVLPKLNEVIDPMPSKTQAAIAMEQRAKVAKKTEAAGVYRKFIEEQKRKTKEKNA